MKYTLIIIFLFLTGCANPGIVKLSPDTYILYREDHAGIFGSASSLKAGVIRDANAFAQKQGKVAVPLSTNATPMGRGPAQWASFEYQFRVVEKSDSENKRTSLVPRANIVIEQKNKITAEIKTEHKINKDIYTELIKLNELREKNIINDEEFKSLKLKLIN